MSRIQSGPHVHTKVLKLKTKRGSGTGEVMETEGVRNEGPGDMSFDPQFKGNRWYYKNTDPDVYDGFNAFLSLSFFCYP